MLSIIKSDLYRISKGKAIYIVILIILILNIVSAVGLDAGHIGLSVETNIDVTDSETLAQISSVNSISDYRKLMKSFGTFPLDKDVIGQNVNLYYLFICTDFSNKSIKNTLSSAISKRKYYLSKLFLILGLSTMIVLFNNYSFYLINLIINGKAFTSSLIDIGKYTVVQLPLIYGIISMLCCFAFIFRKTSIFNTVTIPFIMAFQLIVTGIINLFHIKADWFFNYEFQYASYYLLSVLPMAL